MNKVLQLALIGALAFTSRISAEIIRFDTDPFAGSTVLTTPGRQFVGNEVFLPTFDFANDVFSFDAKVFNVPVDLSFFNGFGATLPASGFDVIVLQDSDPDNNPATPFNAGTSADLIASRVTTPGPGFFVYFNTVLGVNRLVYSTDLSQNTSDLKILARIVSPTGQDAINALPEFGASNFNASAVPEPSTMGLTGAVALAGVWFIRRRRSGGLKPSAS